MLGRGYTQGGGVGYIPRVVGGTYTGWWVSLLPYVGVSLLPYVGYTHPAVCGVYAPCRMWVLLLLPYVGVTPPAVCGRIWPSYGRLWENMVRLMAVFG